MGFGFVVARFGIFGDEPHIMQQTLSGELNRDQFGHRSLSKQGAMVALFLALLGIAMTIYLTLFLAQPPDALHASLAGMATGQ
jgi:hypothetical protein